MTHRVVPSAELLAAEHCREDEEHLEHHFEQFCKS
jgi:hypothetical protein